jgi:hypothetical protein
VVPTGAERPDSLRTSNKKLEASTPGHIDPKAFELASQQARGIDCESQSTGVIVGVSPLLHEVQTKLTL